jgi:hypothetical protein
MAGYRDVLWVRNNKGHGSTAQNSVWHCIKMLSDFEEAKADIDGFNEKSIIKGEKDFYTFMKTLYEDMYANPDRFAIPAMEYDEYMKSINVDKVFSNAHKGDAKESKLRNRFQQAIQFYPDYFYKLGLAADEICKKTYALIIQKTKYTNVLKALNYTHIKNENGLRLAALSGMGINLKETNNAFFLTCKQFPKMFLGLKVLLSSPENKYKYLNYLRLNYNGRYRPMPEIEDIFMTLEKVHCECIKSLLSLYDKQKIKYSLYPFRTITSSGKWTVDYFIKSKRVFGFYAGPGFLAIRILFKNTDSLQLVINTLESNNPKLFEWFRDNFRGCNNANCKRNRIIMIGNQKRHTCGGSSKIEITISSKNDIKKCTMFMKMAMS